MDYGTISTRVVKPRYYITGRENGRAECLEDKRRDGGGTYGAVDDRTDLGSLRRLIKFDHFFTKSGKSRLCLHAALSMFDSSIPRHDSVYASLRVKVWLGSPNKTRSLNEPCPRPGAT